MLSGERDCQSVSLTIWRSLSVTLGWTCPVASFMGISGVGCEEPLVVSGRSGGLPLSAREGLLQRLLGGDERPALANGPAFTLRAWVDAAAADGDLTQAALALRELRRQELRSTSDSVVSFWVASR